MRAIWKGALSFGLVHIPVRLYSATSPQKLSFRQLHKKCHSPVRYKKFCPTCQRELAEEEISRGYEYQKGKFVLLEDEELAQTSQDHENIQIKAVHAQTEVDPIYFDKTYYLEASEGGVKAYSLLRQALLDKSAFALALIKLRTKSTLCLVRPYGDTLLSLTTLFYADQIRSSEEISHSLTETVPEELKMAHSLLDNLSASFQPEKYSDEERQAIEELIEKKLAGESIAVAPPSEGKVIDLVEALKASVEATKPRRTRKKA